ncbi:MAG TPA: aminotransferase class V-fold PLP-dependent enzyme [Candidatus Borkfalkia excrementipullorum]|nr:aminotransferase class V-fold PLP-dependent enzyme [Candidatus Borkfalkia excrementipullorum]
MIYFDNAATGGRKPSGVLRAVQASLAGICGNPGRSGHALSIALAGQVYECRENLRRFFCADSAERVILTKNCTEALNIAIFGLINAQTYDKKPHIVSTVAEHNSVLRPLFFLERQGKIELTLAPLTDGKVLPESIAGAVQENTLACVFTLASNVTGAAIDAAAVRALLPARVYTICDGAQACGHIPVDMRAAGIDALAVAGHKGMHGIQGSGALLFSERLELAPYMYGGTGSESFNPAMPDFYPDKLEAGTLSCLAAASLTEGVLYLETHMEDAAKKVYAMTEQLVEGLQKIKNVRVFSRPNPYGIAAFSCSKLQSEFFAQELSDDYRIAVRGGLHCAPKMHDALGSGRDGLVRASLSEFNSPAEVQEFLKAAQEIAERF